METTLNSTGLRFACVKQSNGAQKQQEAKIDVSKPEGEDAKTQNGPEQSQAQGVKEHNSQPQADKMVDSPEGIFKCNRKWTTGIAVAAALLILTLVAGVLFALLRTTSEVKVVRINKYSLPGGQTGTVKTVQVQTRSAIKRKDKLFSFTVKQVQNTPAVGRLLTVGERTASSLLKIQSIDFKTEIGVSYNPDGTYTISMPTDVITE